VASLKSFRVAPEVKRRRGPLFRGPRAAFLLAAFSPATLAAQGRFFPDVLSFELPAASPRVAGFAGRLIDLSRGESQFGAEREADVAVGETFPVIALRRGPRPLTLGFGVEVYGRFSLDDSKSSMISNDWTVGFDLYQVRNDWIFALQLYHESSHLGDEYAATFDASRIDWTREVATGWIGYRPGKWRFMVGASRVLVDELKLSPWMAGLGVDYRGRGLPLIGQRLAPLAAVYLEGASATDWRISNTLKLGLVLTGARSGREMTLSLLRHDGLSSQRQFFRNESRYFGMEIGFQL
jgi:hypothetical protein